MSKTNETAYTVNAIYEEIMGKGLDRDPEFDAAAYAEECLDIMDPPHTAEEREAIATLVVERLA